MDGFKDGLRNFGRILQGKTREQQQAEQARLGALQAEAQAQQEALERSRMMGNLQTVQAQLNSGDTIGAIGILQKSLDASQSPKAKQIYSGFINSLDSDPSGVRAGLDSLLATQATGAESPAGFSAVTQPFENGASVQYDNRGERVVRGPDGRIAQSPEEEAAILRDAGQWEDDRRAKRDRAGFIVQQDAEVRKEYNEKIRANRSRQALLREALLLNRDASGGYSARAKMLFSRLVPGVDASDERALDAALTGLAFSELQKFKGPTTDFEFRVAQSIPGSITDTRKQREALLNSLSRASWFEEKEYEQYKRWTDNPQNNPSDFRGLDLSETVKIGKQEVSLKRIQEAAAKYHIGMDDAISRLRELERSGDLPSYEQPANETQAGGGSVVNWGDL